MPERAAQLRSAAGKPLTVRGARTRARLLDSAESLFGRQGFHATAVGDITREAGVGQGTFYLYFQSKEEVFRALVHHLSHELRLATRRAAENVCDRLAAEEAGLRAFLKFAAAHRDLYRIVFESQFIDPGTFRWYYERIAEGYTRGLEDAMEEGQIRRYDPETLAYCLMGAAHFLGMRWVVWEGKEPPAEAIHTLLAFFRAAMMPEGGEEAAHGPMAAD